MKSIIMQKLKAPLSQVLSNEKLLPIYEQAKIGQEMIEQDLAFLDKCLAIIPIKRFNIVLKNPVKSIEKIFEGARPVPHYNIQAQIKHSRKYDYTEYLDDIYMKYKGLKSYGILAFTEKKGAVPTLCFVSRASGIMYCLWCNVSFRNYSYIMLEARIVAPKELTYFDLLSQALPTDIKNKLLPHYNSDSMIRIIDDRKPVLKVPYIDLTGKFKRSIVKQIDSIVNDNERIITSQVYNALYKVVNNAIDKYKLSFDGVGFSLAFNGMRESPHTVVDKFYNVFVKCGIKPWWDKSISRKPNLIVGGWIFGKGKIHCRISFLYDEDTGQSSYVYVEFLYER